jgi:hypothetical protein
MPDHDHDNLDNLQATHEGVAGALDNLHPAMADAVRRLGLRYAPNFDERERIRLKLAELETARILGPGPL